MEKEFLFDVGITNATEEKILEYILQAIKQNQKPYYIVTPNPEIVMYAAKNIGFKKIINNAKIALCDGIGLVLAAMGLKKKRLSRVTGVDLMETLCKEVSTLNTSSAKKPITIGFLGGGFGIAERTAECLASKNPGLKVVFVGQEWFQEDTNLGLPNAKFKTQNAKLLFKTKNELNARRYTLDAPIDILFVAFGFPKQEEWMASHVDKNIFRVAIGVGGSFDYISGNIARAPKFLQDVGFEWLFRLIRQPWRIKRQLALVEFVGLVMKGKLGMLEDSEFKNKDS